MSEMNIAEIVKKIIRERVGSKASELHDDSDLNSLGVDSLDMAEIVMDIEEEFHCTIDDTQVTSMKTVRDVIDYLGSLPPSEV